MHDLGFTIPTLDPFAAHADNWWGLNINHELESKINSKITSAKLAIKTIGGFQW